MGKDTTICRITSLPLRAVMRGCVSYTLFTCDFTRSRPMILNNVVERNERYDADSKGSTVRPVVLLI